MKIKQRIQRLIDDLETDVDYDSLLEAIDTIKHEIKEKYSEEMMPKCIEKIYEPMRFSDFKHSKLAFHRIVAACEKAKGDLKEAKKYQSMSDYEWGYEPLAKRVRRHYEIPDKIPLSAEHEILWEQLKHI